MWYPSTVGYACPVDDVGRVAIVVLVASTA